MITEVHATYAKQRRISNGIVLNSFSDGTQRWTMRGKLLLSVLISCWVRCRCIDCYQCYSTELRDPCTGAFGRPPQEFGAHAMSKFCDGGTTVPSRGFFARAPTTPFGQDVDPFCVINVWRARGRHSWIVKRGCFSARIPYPPLMSTLITLRSNATNATRTELRCTVDKLEHGESITCLCRTDNCNAAPPTHAPPVAAAAVAALAAWLSPLLSLVSRLRHKSPTTIEAYPPMVQFE